MKEQFKYIGDEIKQRYMKILSNYYPAHGSTGFTERNLTNNLVLAFERVLGESCISWFEAPICLNNDLAGNSFIFFSNSKLKFPSLEKIYEDNKDLKNVFPLFGYDANQTIILKSLYV